MMSPQKQRRVVITLVVVLALALVLSIVVTPNLGL